MNGLHHSPVVALVVAAGAGSRLGGPVPKALVPVGGVPLVLRSVRQLAAGGVDAAFVVIAPALADDFGRVLVDAPIPCRLVPGGAERQDSVANGLAALDAAPEFAAAQVVLVHDAARAFVPAQVVAGVVDAVRSGAAAAVPVVPVVDSMRACDEAGSTVVDRSRLRTVQTPQGFGRAVLREAHLGLAASGAGVTDDATAAERAGYRVVLTTGSREAFKVTDPFDVLVAEALAAREDEC